MRVDDERAEALGRAVDTGRQPGRPCPDDQQVDLPVLGLDRRAGRARELDVARVGERRAVREDHHRQLAVSGCLTEQLPALVGVGEAERVGKGAPLEHVPQLGGTARPGVADHLDRVRRGAPFLGPLEQERRDRVVEELVRRRHGPDDVVVDLPVLDRLEDRVTGRAEAPLAPAHEQRALGVRMQMSYLGEQFAAGRVVELLSREHEGHGFSLHLELGEPPASVRRRSHADDRVVAGVPAEQLALDRGEGGGIAVDDQDDGVRHGLRIGRVPCRHGSVDPRRAVALPVLRRRQPIA